MIKVQFKNSYENEYTGKEYTFADYKGCKVDDIVVVNTKKGYGLAKVSAVDIFDENFLEEELSTVELVISTKEQRLQKEKEKAMQQREVRRLIKKIEKQKILNLLKDNKIVNDESELENFSTEILKTLYKELTKQKFDF